MSKLSDLLHELGISKVKLAKFLGVSRQMIYNYLELDDINKWPKDKKVLMLNLLGIKNLGVGTVTLIIDELKKYIQSMDEEIDVVGELDIVINETLNEDELDGDVIIPPIDPDIPVLADEYAVVKNRIFRRYDYARIADAPIMALDLRVRASNCLREYNITKVSQLIGVPFDEFKKIRNLGIGTINEIIEKLDLYLQKHVISDGNIKFKVLPTDKILTYLEENPFVKFSEEDSIVLFEGDEESILSAIDVLIKNKTLIFENGFYTKNYPSFFDWVEKLINGDDDTYIRCSNILRLRSEGSTLEEIGQNIGLRRERVRQLELKGLCKILELHKDLFIEDKFLYLFESYNLERELLNLLGIDEKTIYYLNLRDCAILYRYEKNRPFIVSHDPSADHRMRFLPQVGRPTYKCGT